MPHILKEERVMARKRRSNCWINEETKMEPGGVVAFVWRGLLKDMGLTEADIDRKINEFVNRFNKDKVKFPEVYADVKQPNPSTLRKDVRDDSTMTIKTFIKLLQHVVCVDSIKIDVTVQTSDPVKGIRRYTAGATISDEE